MITMDQKQKATANLRTLMQQKSDLHGTYDHTTHTIEAYRIVTGVPQFRDWFNSTDWIRKRLTMKKSSMFDLWVVDNDAPKLRNKPTHAVIYDKQLDQFRPAVNLATVTYALLYFAAAQAIDDAAKCNLFRERYKRMPDKSDLPEIERIIVPGAEPGSQMPAGIADLLTRINATPGPKPGLSADAGPGTSQIRADSDSDPKTKRAKNPDRYHLSHRGKHSL